MPGRSPCVDGRANLVRWGTKQPRARTVRRVGPLARLFFVGGVANPEKVWQRSAATGSVLRRECGRRAFARETAPEASFGGNGPQKSEFFRFFVGYGLDIHSEVVILHSEMPGSIPESGEKGFS